MHNAYCELHDSGLAHSVEVWRDGDLVGGLYGLSLGQMFFGESMFSTISDGSKLAFYHLNQRLLDWNFTLIDCQMMNPHLESLGVQPMHRDEFLALLASNDLSKTRLGPWSDRGSDIRPDIGSDVGSTLNACTESKAQEPWG
jgi:leucyl/phenylalanyl-tRNA--protein transferase